jgi:hypothetical protein
MLRSDPDLLGSARALLHALARTPDADVRVAVLNRVAKRLGNEWYPAFIKLACIVGESDDEDAKRLLADTLAHAMKKGDLPSGSLTSWGASGNWVTAPTGVPGSFFRSAPRRNLGPIEYLSSWHSQSTNRPPLTDDVYRTSLIGLLRLFSASPAAARAYQSKLQADSVNELEGTFTAVTRTRLAAIAELWTQGLPHADLAWRIVQLGHASSSGFDRLVIRPG